MTDTQAKLADVEATWRIALKSPKFPTHHGADDFESIFAQIHSALFTTYEDNVSRVFAEILSREMARDARRKMCLKVIAAAVVTGVAAVVVYAKLSFLR